MKTCTLAEKELGCAGSEGERGGEREEAERWQHNNTSKRHEICLKTRQKCCSLLSPEREEKRRLHSKTHVKKNANWSCV